MQHGMLRLHVAYDQQQCDQFSATSSSWATLTNMRPKTKSKIKQPGQGCHSEPKKQNAAQAAAAGAANLPL